MWEVWGFSPLVKDQGGIQTPPTNQKLYDFEMCGHQQIQFHLPYNSNLVTRARELRKNMTPAEKKLWY
ncbi:hypothetical protein [Moorena sp. SIO3B2]|uniref:hypothetical protein n=1 Tax=Moorena sp. SIO3B2 TaxID=2607827 RepID=UPI00257C8934|nr:hypothetical protein [Moorena sp. SIO3B2]